MSAYISLILSDTQYYKQLWSLGKAYIQQKNEGDADSLLTSIAVFQSRGSITATQGHIPEKRLREYMVDWGLVPDLDFNIFDVEIGELLGDIEVDEKIKKRKYDFIIPGSSVLFRTAAPAPSPNNMHVDLSCQFITFERVSAPIINAFL